VTWTRISDDRLDKPDLLSCSRSARLLHIEALVYCNRHGTDGLVPHAALGRICDDDDIAGLLKELVDAGAWFAGVEGPPAWVIDWAAEKQEPSSRVDQRRRENTARQKLFRRRQELHGAGDHSECHSCPVRKLHDRGDHSECDGAQWCRNAVTDGVTDGVGNTPPVPTRPVPSRPRVREGERDGGANARTASAQRATRPPSYGPPPGVVPQLIIVED